MSSLGNLLWIVGIGAFFFLMMRKGGGCCGGENDHNKDHGDDKEQPRGGC
jgi:hypothetical protein